MSDTFKELVREMRILQKRTENWRQLELHIAVEAREEKRRLEAMIDRELGILESEV